ncbi:hypothetical protein AYI69_g7439 [Smittium culicis]|uniref:Uncharacterized protein n=1 Tax=Smittium culicis TaxID=133412 RepID=A0A1R1XS18_9FUNG|nr:hypothetical protein AYI69_g7439 [Smittium culicis]
MKPTVSTLIFATVALLSVSALPHERHPRDFRSVHDGIEQVSNQADSYHAEENDQNEADDNNLAKRGGPSSYYRKNGRSYYFNKPSSKSFIVNLSYRPSKYYGQTFQFLYQCSSKFQNYWDSSSSFRSSWNSDPNFRNYWLATIYPYGLTQYRQGGSYYNVYNRKSWGGRKKNHRYNKSNNRNNRNNHNNSNNDRNWNQ